MSTWVGLEDWGRFARRLHVSRCMGGPDHGAAAIYNHAWSYNDKTMHGGIEGKLEAAGCLA